MILKTFAYLIYFNNFRKNRNRELQTPKDIFKNEKKKTWQNNWNFKPIIVDEYIKDIEKIKMPGYFYCLPVSSKIKIFLMYINRPPYLTSKERS